VEPGETAKQVDFQALTGFRDFSSIEVQCSELGAAGSLGSLSVPSWAASTPDVEPAAPAPEAPWRTFGEGLNEAMTGQRPEPGGRHRRDG
jgi:PPE-SVP subfamily C-terminal region